MRERLHDPMMRAVGYCNRTQKAHPCVSPRRLSHHARKSVDGFPEKGVKIGYISPIRREAPERGRTCTEFSSAVGVVDITTFDKLFGHQLRVLIL